jgi:RNA polymerase sigma-70 factor (ECF subfamily)
MSPTASRQRSAAGTAAPAGAVAGTAATQPHAARDARLATLLGAAARGDSTAFEAFYDATYAYAHVLARRLLGGGDTDDLLADVFFEAWRKAAAFDAARGSAVTWLLTLVRSRALDLLRHRVVHPSVGGRGTDADREDEPGRREACAPDTDPGDALWRREAGSRLHALVAALSPAERWALGLAYWQELSHAEIAHVTGWPLGTVKSHLLRAQRKLRQALSP